MKIQKRVDKTLEDVVTEICLKNWKHALEAVHDLASLCKTAGYDNRMFSMIMENLEIEVKTRSGSIDEWKTILANKQHYMQGGLIFLPNKIH